MWFRYFDMCSGGGQKTDYGSIFIEADNDDEADRIFEDKFHRDPHNVTCDCCGGDYSISEVDSNNPGIYDNDSFSIPKEA